MYASPYDSEDRTFPFGLAAAAVFVVLGGLMFAFIGGKQNPPVPPYPMLGCYSSPEAPDLSFDAFFVTVLQHPPVKVRSSLKYIKGWAFDIDQDLTYHQDAKGKIVVDAGSPPGEFLFLVREGEFASRTPGFDLPSRAGDFTIRYSRSGTMCGSARNP